MKYLKELINYLKSLFQSSKPDLRNIRRIMDLYFNMEDWPYQTNITNIDARYNQDGSILIDVETHRPGLIIGKGGHFLHGLEKFLSRELKTDTEIRLTENRMWYNLYSDL